MTDEQREINRRVAVAMGYDVLKDPYTTWGYYLKPPAGRPDHVTPRSTPEAAWRTCPGFCTDPAAADLVRLEIERRGWLWSIDPGIEGTKRYFCCVSGGTPRCSEPPYARVDGDSWMETLCLAFLAACEATDTE
jgi:hypothetical protein